MPERSVRHTAGCPVCDGSPRVLVAIRHAGMRHLTADLLAREYHCWVATEPWEVLAAGVRGVRPDLLIVDEADFPACWLRRFPGFPRSRVVVIGPEPDPAYRSQAIGDGAGAWITRERVGEELGPAMRAILGCVHDPCPPHTPASHRHARPPAVAAH